MTERFTLSDKRCFNHGDREPVGLCPGCSRFFCRECVSDHDGRLLCSRCLQELSDQGEERQLGLMAKMLPFLRLGLGFFAACFAFYLLATCLLTFPSTIHDVTIPHEKAAR